MKAYRHLKESIKKIPENVKSCTSSGISIITFLIIRISCGETGIRTPGTSQFNGFQDRRNRPLCHLSQTSFQKCFPLKAVQRYGTFLIPQTFRGKNSFFRLIFSFSPLHSCLITAERWVRTTFLVRKYSIRNAPAFSLHPQALKKGAFHKAPFFSFQ